jgi:hypothetical protein
MQSAVNEYRECMQYYGLKHFNADTTPRDIADGASAECQSILDECVIYMADNLKVIRYGEQYVSDPYGRARAWGMDQLVLGQKITINAVIYAREAKK